MTQKTITFKFVIPELLAVALGIMILIGIIYLSDKYPVPTNRTGADRITTPDHARDVDGSR
jgi:hypothetical protein